jgi:hypothetical protein
MNPMDATIPAGVYYHKLIGLSSVILQKRKARSDISVSKLALAISLFITTEKNLGVTCDTAILIIYFI